MKQSIVILSFFLIAESAKIPSSFKKCSRRDPNFDSCVSEAMLDAIPKLTRAYPEINVPNLEPFVVPELSITTNSRSIQASQQLKDSKYYGLTRLQPRKIEWDFDKKTLTLEGVFPELRNDALYEIDGKILLLNLKGEGTRHVILKNLDFKIRLNFEETKKKDKTYMKFVTGDIDLKPGSLHIEFENLFNDKALSDNINKSLNENWEAVWEGIQNDTREIVLKIVMNLGNGVFGKVSMEEAFD